MNSVISKRSCGAPTRSGRHISSRRREGIPGRDLGGFRYYDTRPDDPNDVVPHQDRRVLRAMRVFGAWTNLVDMKAGNTHDSLITENGKSVVRHYLQDVGSTFGTGANALREWDEGYEYLFEGELTMKRLVTFGFFLNPWQTVPTTSIRPLAGSRACSSIPIEWKPRVPTAAFVRARADDNFWAARRVMAFSDDLIRAIAATGQYHDEAAARLLADVLIQRRDKIAQAYLTAINPSSTWRSTAATPAISEAAVEARLASEPAGGYVVRWADFDNTTGTPPTRSRSRRTRPTRATPTRSGTCSSTTPFRRRLRRPARARTTWWR